MKTNLAVVLKKTQHDSSLEFDLLISDYTTKDVTDDQRPTLSALREILAHPTVKSLCIEGKIDEPGWEALIKAMPDHLPTETLTLSKVPLDHSRSKLLFMALGRMPALNCLSLTNVEFDSGFFDFFDFFDHSDCPVLPLLATLNVVATSSPNVSVSPLLLKILAACELRSLSIEDYREISADGHARLAKALFKQPRLNSLRLKIARRYTPEEFKRYMEFLCGTTPLAALDLSGCSIGTRNFNPLLKALSKNQRTLKSLSLSGCWLTHNPNCKEPISINILPLAEMGSLQHLDLSQNSLPTRATAALLDELKKNPTCLTTLNLSGNWVGPATISAMASLLQENNTLIRLWFEPSMMQTYLGDTEKVLEELAQAVECNKSLRELHIHWSRLPRSYYERLNACLDRNRKEVEASRRAAMQAATNFVLPLLLKSGQSQFPTELIQHVIGQGLTQRDALALSSITPGAWASRQEFLRKIGS
ncbi:hypothetical protein [Variovorax guangxiensis]|uniref:hypothetical protein n=1 Tax=Variovorax guangxiensis TaxID=1775474 RepID=UPI002859D9A8|nr:hypothetical protein [Variovorax guangxiensis]MDR6857656.1 hypothetical protein [Variovorax guangxiensis]